jgi:hypothetical protein
MTGPAPLVLTDAWIERMLVERAGSAAPMDLVGGIASRVGVTPQRRLRLWPTRRPGEMPRAGILLIAATIALLAIGIATAIGSRLIQPPPKDLPLPTALMDRWLGDPVDVAGVGSSSQPMLDLSDGDLVLRGIRSPARALQSSVAIQPPATLRLTSAADANGCPPGSRGTYRYTLSPGGLILTLATVQEDCQNRSAALARTWYRKAVVCESGTIRCIGELEAGTFKSVNLDVRLSHAEIQAYVPTFGVLTYTVPDGWAVSRDSRTQLWLNPTSEYEKDSSDRQRSISVFARLTAYSQAEGCPYAALDPPIESSPDAFARWIAERPGVDAGPIHEITIDGHRGRWLDTRLAATWTSPCGWSDGKPYKPLLFFEDGEEGSQGIGPTETQRTLFLDLGDGDMVVVIVQVFDPASFDDFAAEAMPIVESFKFR